MKRCGKKLLCRQGNRGPCHRNEVFLVQNKQATSTKKTCSNFMSYPWNGCFPASKAGSSALDSVPSGCCSLRFPRRPCFGYPPTYRFFRPNKRCYPCSNWYFKKFALFIGVCVCLLFLLNRCILLDFLWMVHIDYATIIYFETTHNEIT